MLKNAPVDTHHRGVRGLRRNRSGDTHGRKGLTCRGQCLKVKGETTTRPPDGNGSASTLSRRDQAPTELCAITRGVLA